MRPLRRHGFTLVELLVVIVVLGIATAVVAPSLRSVSGSDTASELLALYGAARREATTRGAVVTLRLRVEDGSFVLLASRAAGEPGDTLRAGALPLPAGVSLRGGSGGQAVAVFAPLGTARADAVLISSSGRTYVVVVDPWTATADRRRL